MSIARSRTSRNAYPPQEEDRQECPSSQERISGGSGKLDGVIRMIFDNLRAVGWVLQAT